MQSPSDPDRTDGTDGTDGTDETNGTDRNDTDTVPGKLLAVDWASDTLIVATLDPHTGLLTVATAKTGANPRAVAAGPGGAVAHTANHAAPAAALSCVPLDKLSDATSYGSARGACAVLADLHDDHVCVASSGDRLVQVYRGRDTTPTGRVAVPGRPFALAAGRSGATRVGVALTEPDTAGRLLVVVDLADPAQPALLPLPPQDTVPGTVRDLTASPDGKFLYAVSRLDGGSGSLTVVDLAGAPHVVRTVPVEADPVAVAVSRDGRTLAVACQGAACLWAAALDAGTGLPGAPVVLPVVLRPSALALSSDGGLACVTGRTTGRVSTLRLDLADPARPAGGNRRDLAGGATPSHVAFATDDAHAYLTDQGNLLTLRTGPAQDGTIDTGRASRPVAAAVTPDHAWLCTADSAANHVTVTELAKEGPAKPLTLAPDTLRPWGIATGAVPGSEPFICVTSPDTGGLAVLVPEKGHRLGDTDHVTTRVIALPPGTEPRGVAVTPDGRHALVADSRSGPTAKDLLVIDLVGGSTTIPRAVTACTRPVGVAVADDGNTLYVSDCPEGMGWGDDWGRISLLRRSAGAWTLDQAASVTVDSKHLQGPHEIAVRRHGTETTLYVTNYSEAGGTGHQAADRTVSVFTRSDGGTWTHRYLKGKDANNRAVSRPHGIAVSSDGKWLYVSSSATGSVAQFSLDGGASVLEHWLETSKQDDNWASLALSADGAYLYATSQGTNEVYGIAVPQTADAQMTVVAGLEGVKAPRAVAASGTDTLHVATSATGGTPQLFTVTLDPHNRLSALHAVPDEVPLAAGGCNGVAALAADGPVFLTDDKPGTVEVRGAQVRQLPLGDADSRLWDVVCTPDGRYACVTDRHASKPAVHTVRLADPWPVTAVTVPADPMGVTCSPDGLHAYTACHLGNGVGALVRPPVPLDSPPVTLTPSAAPKAAAAHPDGEHLYRVCGDEVVPVRLTGTDDGTKLAVPGVCALAVRAEGKFGYALCTGTRSTVQALDLSAPSAPKPTGTPLELSAGPTPTAFALHPSLPGLAYAAGSTGRGTGVLWALGLTAPDRPAFLGTVPVGVPVTALALLPGSPGHLYLLAPAGASDSALHVWELPADDPSTVVERPRARLDLGGRPRSMALHPGGGHAYVSTEDHRVHLVDLTDPGAPALVGSTDVTEAGVLAARPDGNGAWLVRSAEVSGVGLGTPAAGATWTGLTAPQRLAVSADGSRVLVTGENSGVLHLVDAATGRFRRSVTSGSSLAGVAVHPDPAKDRAYVADTGNGRLVIVDTAAPRRTGSQPVGLDVRQIICE
ncbi:beta-propeller fold lactonase family protein [Kitasatospora sp. NPDC127116]|uniref:beta-propeller fold lactonase family protein n=1 Tax=Kitasatospora sp. NPDC127116 TaxID=3345367 RepID=UPI00362FC4AD